MRLPYGTPQVTARAPDSSPARNFADVAQPKWCPKYTLGLQLNAFMAVGILLKYFRRMLLKFE